MEKVLLVGFLAYLASVACNGEGLGDSIQVSINDQGYSCSAGEGSTPAPTQPGDVPVFCDRTFCQVLVTNASLQLKEENPKATGAGLYCSFITGAELIACVEEVFSGPCAETDPEDADLIFDQLEALLRYYQDNCICADSNTVNPECINKDPCETAQPCNNGGQCVSKPIRSNKSYYPKHYYHDYHDDATEYEFIGCVCPEGFSGQFCQDCDSCKKCRRFGECNCPAGYGGPTCTLTCADIKKSRRALYQHCIQVTMDDYYALFLPSLCFLNLEMSQCIAATAGNCGFDAADVGEETHFEYWVSVVEEIIEFLIVNGGCALFGDLPPLRH